MPGVIRNFSGADVVPGIGIRAELGHELSNRGVEFLFGAGLVDAAPSSLFSNSVRRPSAEIGRAWRMKLFKISFQRLSFSPRQIQHSARFLLNGRFS